MIDLAVKIGEHDLEYIDETHTYVVDGILVPSITGMLQKKFRHKYDGVNRAILNNASRLGTQMHETIQRYCEEGYEDDSKELHNFKFLQKHYGFEVLKNEVPVILFHHGEPIGAGRLDMVISMNGERGLADLKRTSTLDKEYLGYQLNLYRLAYMQSYDEDIGFLKGIHLREDKRKFVDIPINEELIYIFINDYMNERGNNE